jgi:5,6-dimethylbenzimidazole synthase
MPDGADPIAVLCVGPVPEFPDRPELEIVGWTTARPLDELVYTNTWPV